MKIVTFTEKGRNLAETIISACSDIGAELADRDSKLSDICREAFKNREAVVFIGAMGIAVRSIAPYVADKLSDPPVIVIDEAGKHVIPVLSGHIGGANELAVRIADSINAEPVLTTATDVSGAFSVDLFAKENDLRIVNREGIAKVSSSALAGKAVTICIKDYPPKNYVDVLVTDESALKDSASIVLCPRKYAVGIGCRKGKPFDEIRNFAESVLTENGIIADEIGAIATVDVKKNEPGLLRLSQYWRVPLLAFESAVLNKVQGEFASSERVLSAVGTDNVCERASAAAAGKGYKLIVRKTACNGITIAVSERK